MGTSNTNTAPNARTARDEGRDLAQNAAGSTRQVAETAKQQTGQVVQEASTQARNLAGQARSQVMKQADQQRQRLAGTLRDSGRELSEFADREGQSQLTTELSRRASSYVQTIGDYLDNADPQRMLEDVRSFARRRPGAFLTIAAVGGLIAGRLTRSIAAGQSSDGQSSARQASYGQPSYGQTTYGQTTYGESSEPLPTPPPPLVDPGVTDRDVTGSRETQTPRPDVLP